MDQNIQQFYLQIINLFYFFLHRNQTHLYSTNPLILNKPTNHRVYRFQLLLMKFSNLHIVWTAGKNVALPDTLSRNTPPELLTRQTTVEIPQNIKFYHAKNETSPRLECKYAVKTDIDQSQIKNLQHFHSV